jgi:60 kDa SS-A/Ro ribonucleoprotein
MAINYAKQFRTRRTATPQTQPIPGSNQVKNNAGGFAWQITPWERMERFLVLGAEGGTYYVGEQNLVKQNHDSVLACLKEDGSRVVRTIVEVSTAGRAYKNDPAIFALALACAHGNQDAKQAAYAAVPKVCRIGTHLFHFAEYVGALRGWGRGLRNAVGRWYTQREADKLAYQMVKYQSRDKWSHGDLLRLAHPTPPAQGHDALFRWAVGGVEALNGSLRQVKRRVGGKTQTQAYAELSTKNLPAIVNAFEEAKTADEKRTIVLILERNLPRECVRTEMLNSVKVWDALLQNMPMTAMIRNLGKMSQVGLLKPLSAASKLVCERLVDVERIRKARIHPLQVLIALKTYAQGHGFKGSLKWDPVQQIADTMDDTFYASFGNVTPIGKPVLLGLDVSGSMTCGSIAGTMLTPAEAVAALALVTARVEKEHFIMAFDHGIQDLRISPKMRLDAVLRKVSNVNGGGTNCALPMIYAAQERLNVGGFVVLTDNETWAGSAHPSEALRQYRSQFVEDAREVVVGMTATDVSIADPNDKFALDVVGFDGNCPSLISDFIRGEAKASTAEED